LIVLPKSY